MDRTEIRKAASELTDRFSLLVLLNRIKKGLYGDAAYPFTMAQLNYFCHPARNAKHYKTFTIPKKSGKLREISAPEKMLKSMLTCMNVLLQAMYEPTGSAMGFVPGRSVVDNARKHVGMNYVLNMDLENFFPSIPQARVWGTLQSKAVGFNRTIANAVAGLCCTEMTFVDGRPAMTSESPEEAVTEIRNVLPQGAPTSPVLTNLVCRNLDRKLSSLARHYGLNYTRYADDITFSSMHNVYQKDGEFRKQLQAIIEAENFSVNPAKTRLQVKGMRQDVTGLVVSDRVNVTKDYVRSIASLLFIWKQYGYNDAYARFLVHYGKGPGREVPPFERVLQGKLMYLKMVKGEDDPVVVRLLTLFDTLMATRPRKKKIYDTETMFQVEYLASYQMQRFEKNFSTTVNITAKEKGNSASSLRASCIIKGEEVHMALSTSCKAILFEALKTNDEKLLESVKQKLHVTYCRRHAEPYWLIMKSRPLSTYSYLPSDMTPSGHEEMMQDDDLPQILEDLVKSNFDLNLLKKWNTTKSI